MSITILMRKLSCLPGIRRKRVRIWAIAVLATLLLLGLQAAFPECRPHQTLSWALAPKVALAIFFAAMVCEYVDSSLGMGYGTTLTPALLLAGFEPLQLVPCVLLSEFLSGLSAFILHHRDGNVDLLHDGQAKRATVMISLLSVVGTIAAVTLAVRIPGSWLKGLIGAVILLTGLTTLATIRQQLRYRPGHLIALGAVAAFNKGLSGGGYGPLVTSGQVVSGLSAKKAVAITSLAESLTCFVGLTAYLILGKTIDWGMALPLTTGALMSVPIATLTVRRIPERAMRASVGVATILLGTLTLARLLW